MIATLSKKAFLCKYLSRPTSVIQLRLPCNHLIRPSSLRSYCNQVNWNSITRSKQNRLLLFSSLTISTISLIAHRNKLKAKIVKKDEAHFEAGKRMDGLKEYNKLEVNQHNSIEKGIWVIFRNGVYDITKFIEQHPGGDKILLGAGQDIEPFWNLYAAHKDPQIYKLLESYRIGNLLPDDVNTEGVTQDNDPYQFDPKRPGYFAIRSAKPFNAEPPLNVLADSWLTPNELFYIRNHLPVPDIQPDEYELEIEGFGIKNQVKLSLKELKEKFPKHTVCATIQCAGNRRSEMTKVKQVRGLFWGGAAISNAKWSGAKLVDVLKYCDADLKDEKIKHIVFDGADTDATGSSYGASVPAETALDASNQFILAYEMNDAEIPKDHGYPVRLIAPGIAGARNVKWLNKITLSAEESHSHWQRKDYKGFSPNVDWDNVDFEKSPSIQEMPIQSAICDPVDGSTVTPNAKGFITVKGYAWSGGGRKVVRVDVSPDGGSNWITADLEQEDTPLNRTYSWTLWKADLPVGSLKQGSNFQVVCKAIDSSYNNQPENVEPIWNLRGVLTNSWHRINLKLT